MALLALSALVGLVCLYFVSVNLLLGTRLLRDVVGYNPNALRLDYERAYSSWPGRIHVEGLRLRGRDSSVEWLLSIDRCTFRVSFAELFRRRFHASQVEADGLSLRLRRRQDQVTREAMSATPEIPGFVDPPLSDFGPPPPPSYDDWSIRLDGVHVRHVREVWIDTVRNTGEVVIKGSWGYRPMQWLEVGPATVEVLSLDVWFGEVERWVAGARGTLEATVHPTDLLATRGSELASQMTARGDVAGEAELGTLVNRLLGPGSERAARGTASIDAHVDVERGVVVAGTKLTLAPFAAASAAGPFSFGCQLTARFWVDQAGSTKAAVQCVDLHVGRGKSRVAEAGYLSIGTVLGRLDFAHIPANAPLGFVGSVAFDAPDVEVPSLNGLMAVGRLPDGVGARDARARASLRARGVPGRLDVSGSSLQVVGDDGWWGGVELTQGTISGIANPRFAGHVLVRAKDAKPLQRLIANEQSPFTKIAVNALPSEDLSASAEVVASSSFVAVRSARAHCAALDARAELVDRGASYEWALWLSSGMLRAAAHRAGGSTEVTFSDTEPWFEERVRAMRGSVEGAQ